MKKRNAFSVRPILALILVFAIILPCASEVFAAETGWTISEDTRILWVSGEDSQITDAALKEQIQLFDSELAASTAATVLPIVYGKAEDAGANDILLVLDSNLGIAKEGFQLDVNGNSVVVSASDADGLFYGCRNLIQQLITAGVVTDKAEAPDVAERAVSLDNGRKYFSVKWIKDFIREMSWARMNTLVLHFSEEMGLGIESKRYPWLAGRDGSLCVAASIATDNTYLTQEEIAEIVNYAKLYHVEIIPSFDSPGHMNYIVKKFNQKCASSSYSFSYNGKTYTAKAGTQIGNYFHYNNKTSIVQGSRNKSYSRGIDISNETAVAFTRSLVEEYATLFAELGCTKFDIGGDELLGWGTAISSSVPKWQQLDHWKAYAINRTGNSKAVAYDAFLLYMNDLYFLVTDLGYTSVRMWNDDALRSADTGWTGVAKLNSNIDIWYWTSEANSKKNTVWTYLNEGYQVYNILDDYNYYVLNDDYFSSSRESFKQAYADQIYNEWNPYVFDPASTTLGTGKNTALGNPNVLGSAIGVWCDKPSLRTEAQIMKELLPLVQAHAAKAWDADCNKTVSYTKYTAWQKAVGGAPSSLPAAPDVKEILDLTELNIALEEYRTMDPSNYTQSSFAAYMDAVLYAQTLAEANECSQETLDAAVAKIDDMKANLREAVRLDLTALNDAVKAYEEMDATAYTVESFGAYTKAVTEAQALAENTDSDQKALDAAVTKIGEMKALLRTVDTVSEKTIITSLQSKSTRVVKGKLVTLTLISNEPIQGVEVYDDLGNRVTLKVYSVARNSTNTKYRVTFQFVENNKGTRTYTVYAVDGDGNRSADYKQCKVYCY